MLEKIKNFLGFTEASIAGIKELFRFMLSYAIGAVLTWLVVNIDALEPIKNNPTTAGLLVAFIGGLVRGIDKWIHKVGKERGNENLSKGLLRF